MKTILIAILIGLSMMLVPCSGIAAEVECERFTFDTYVPDTNDFGAHEILRDDDGADASDFNNTPVQATASNVDTSAGPGGLLQIYQADEIAWASSAAWVAGLCPGDWCDGARQRVSAAHLSTLGPPGRFGPPRAFEPRAFASVSDSGLVIRSIL